MCAENKDIKKYCLLRLIAMIGMRMLMGEKRRRKRLICQRRLRYGDWRVPRKEGGCCDNGEAGAFSLFHPLLIQALGKDQEDWRS